MWLWGRGSFALHLTPPPPISLSSSSSPTHSSCCCCSSSSFSSCCCCCYRHSSISCGSTTSHQKRTHNCVFFSEPSPCSCSPPQHVKQQLLCENTRLLRRLRSPHGHRLHIRRASLVVQQHVHFRSSADVRPRYATSAPTYRYNFSLNFRTTNILLQFFTELPHQHHPPPHPHVHS